MKWTKQDSTATETWTAHDETGAVRWTLYHGNEPDDLWELHNYWGWVAGFATLEDAQECVAAICKLAVTC